MIFSTNVNHSSTYVVRRADPEYNRAGLPMPGTGPTALRAKFRGAQRLFNSEAAQKEHGWTNEERIEVEAFLIGHADFMAAPTDSGPGIQPRIYLAHGQTIPPEHEELFERVLERLAVEGRLPSSELEAAASALPAPPQHCLAFDMTEDGPTRCPKLAAQGSDLCEEDHRSQVGVS